MKTSPYAIDQKKFAKFRERINREAARLFPDNDGGSRVEVRLRDSTREECSCKMPVPRMDLIETDKEWLDAIAMLSWNSASAADHLTKAIRFWQMDKQTEEKKLGLVQSLSQLAHKLGVTFFVVQDKLPDGWRWKLVGIPGAEHGFSYLNGFNDAGVSGGLSYAEKAVQASVKNNPKSNTFAVYFNSGSLRVYESGKTDAQ